MKRLLLLLLWCCFAVDAVQADTAADVIERQLIVRLEADTNDTIDDLNADYNTTTIDVMNAAVEIYLLQTAPGVDAEALADVLDPSGNGGDARVEYAEANYLSDLPEANPQGAWAWGGQDAGPLGTQYAPALHNLAAAHAFTQGSGVTIAIADAGFQLNHPLLAGRWTAERYDFVANDSLPSDEQSGQDDDGDTQVDEAYGHGTHVAGIINQVAPQADLMPIRMLDSDGRGNLWQIGEAINYAIVHGADVLNLSLGTDYESEMLEDLVQQAEDANLVVVAAAGNLGNSVMQYPAAFPSVLAVSSADSDKIKAPSANYGAWVDVVAAGVSIYSSYPTDGYATWSGTSMATPFVAGEAALLISLSSSRSAASVRDSITGNTINIDAENPAFNGQLGAGLIDIGAAVQSIAPPTAVSLAAQTSTPAASWVLFLSAFALLAGTSAYWQLARTTNLSQF